MNHVLVNICFMPGKAIDLYCPKPCYLAVGGPRHCFIYKHGRLGVLSEGISLGLIHPGYQRASKNLITGAVLIVEWSKAVSLTAHSLFLLHRFESNLWHMRKLSVTCVNRQWFFSSRNCKVHHGLLTKDGDHGCFSFSSSPLTLTLAFKITIVVVIAIIVTIAVIDIIIIIAIVPVIAIIVINAIFTLSSLPLLLLLFFYCHRRKCHCHCGNRGKCHCGCGHGLASCSAVRGISGWLMEGA